VCKNLFKLSKSGVSTQAFCERDKTQVIYYKGKLAKSVAEGRSSNNLLLTRLYYYYFGFGLIFFG
jgi:hypothetical protein